MQETERVGDGTPALAHLLGYFFLVQTKFFDEPSIRLGLLDRIKIVPLGIFNDSKLEFLLFLNVAHHNRYRAETSPLGGLETTFSSDKLIAIDSVLRHHQRLQDAVLPDRLGELIKLLLIEMETRLVRIGDDLSDGDFQNRRAVVLRQYHSGRYHRSG